MWIRKRRDVLANGDRGERRGDGRAVGALERELERADPVRDVEPVEHLGGQEVVRKEAAERALVVTGDERAHERRDARVPEAADGGNPRADEPGIAFGAHD